MVDTVNRMRKIAEKRLGSDGRDALERLYASAIDAIHRGEGSGAISRLATSLSATAAEVGGDELRLHLSSELASLSRLK